MLNRLPHITKPLSNQRGDMLVIAICLVVLSLISSLTIMNYTQQVEVNSKRPRVKSLMTSIESKIRSALLSPSSYSGCASSDTVDVRANCQLDIAKIQSLGINLTDQCPSGKTACGISATVQSNPAGSGILITTNSSGQTVSRVQVRIQYDVGDLNLAPVDVVMDVPADIMQTRGIYACPVNKPKFNGFDSQGKMICLALPPRALPNQFVSAIDINQIKTTTFGLPNKAECPSNSQFISSVSWGFGGTAFNFSCSDRLNPFATFGFVPKQFPAGDVIYTVNPTQ